MKVQDKKQMEKLSNNASVFMKIEKGDTRIRVIGDIHAVKEHDLKVGGKFKAIACPCENARMAIANGVSQDTDVPPCPLCELGYPVKTSYLAKVVERETEKDGKFYGGEAYVLKKGASLLGEIQNLFDDENWGKAGNYDIKITATGDKLERRYSIMAIPADKCQPLSKKEEISLANLDNNADLDEMTTPRPYSEIKEIIGDLPDYETYKANEAF